MPRGGFRTGENGHRAIHHRTLGRSEPVGSGEDREAVAHVADELQQTTRGPPGPVGVAKVSLQPSPPGTDVQSSGNPVLETF